MDNTKTILLHNITPDELKEMIMADLKLEIEAIINRLLDNKPKFYSVQQVSVQLGRSELTVYNYIKKGLLPASKFGRKYLIKHEDLEKTIKDVKSLKYTR